MPRVCSDISLLFAMNDARSTEMAYDFELKWANWRQNDAKNSEPHNEQVERQLFVEVRGQSILIAM